MDLFSLTDVKAVVEVVIAAVFHPELENTSSQFFKDYVARLAPQVGFLCTLTSPERYGRRSQI